ncbi:hypothetical protein [Roseinatronobacter alkalisoli]|uniref:Glutamine amidotransferase domain-containing protein n=1 Tax=Roseinatronobacter alkalisoli TaxID=3028235 RepID=A0ABT5T4I2_9RHOB|nr:hypothetical protein [Roseinatronobacter sp. HJB301]MDD7970031.1 hypothetical protein [Roseinatronobacter sp. HJB301]
MSAAQEIILAPLVPLLVLWGLAGIAAAMVALALWQGLRGWWLRGLAALALLAALANPSLQDETREPLSDIALVMVDETASNRIGGRDAQTEAALAHLETGLAGLDMDTRVVSVPDGTGNEGTQLNSALSAALAEIPRDRLAGVFVVSDGQLHDADVPLSVPAPTHLLQTGRAGDWDRRLIIRNAPAFAILGEPVTLTLKVEDQGAVPPDTSRFTTLRYAVDDAPAQTAMVPIGEELELSVTLDRGGMNVLQFELDEAPGELTTRNNAAIVQINGVRDRLSVLLVSGEPNAGQRTWRNLLKSDPAVDLVHFTILRPPDRHDGVPVDELSLIAFPTRELFVEKIDEFDLIIFDRYRRRGILPNAYFSNIARYVEEGGALLVVGGPELAGAESIWRSPLGDIFPARPTARVIEEGFRPVVTDLGKRHPVTAGLEDLAPASDDGSPAWGRWFRQIELDPQHGQVVMSGVDDRPLLMLDRVGRGRLALLASDQTWLWDRGFEGGGPQLELLRRLAHWMMAEPELEEETLTATTEGNRITVMRRSLLDAVGDVTITAPDGQDTVLELHEDAPGEYRAEWDAPEIGLYQLQEGELSAVVALGPRAPREFEETIATEAHLRTVIDDRRGGVVQVETGLPDLRLVRDGRAAAGRGWLGLTPRDAYVTTELRSAALLPGWLWLLLAAGLSLGAWLREGRT